MGTVKGVAKLKKILYPKNVKSTSGGFAIISLEPVSMEEGNVEVHDRFNTFTIKGNTSPLREGSEYHFVAEEGERHPTFGLGYELIFMRQNVKLDTSSKESVKSFLEIVLTKNQVENLYEAFDNPIEVIESKDIEKLTQAKNVGMKTAQKMIDHFESQKDYSHAYIELGKYELTPLTIKKIVDYYGSPELAVVKVKENPYELMRIDGYGFKSCDKIFLQLGGDRNADIRIKSFAIFALQEQANRGNTWMTPEELIEDTIEYIPDAQMSKVGKIILSDRETFYLTEDKKRVSLLLYQRLENLVSQELNRLMSAENTFEYDNWEEDVELTETHQGWSFTAQQRQAMQMMLDNNVSILQGYGGTGKAMPKWLEIPTPNGTSKMGDVKVGDYVFDRLGKPTKVLGVYPQGELDTYEVTLADGRKTWCNDEHLWSYYTSKGNLKTVTLREMIDNGLWKNNNSGRRYKIPVSKAVEYDEKEFDIDPYVLGAFLGDGSLTSKQLTLCSDDEFVVKEVSGLIGAKGYKRNSDRNYSWSFMLNEVEHIPASPPKILFHTKDIFGSHPDLMCRADTKRVPKEYFYGSIEQRLSLVQGLLDTDGCINNDSRANIRFSNTSKGLVEDLQYILRSLGYQSNINEDIREGRNICYELTVNVGNEEKHKLFRLPRRKDVAISVKDVKKHRDYSKVGIVDIKKLDKKEDMVCIYVENEEHLFLANDFIVTHNTTTLKAVVDILEEKGYLYAQCALSGKASQNLTLVTGKEGNTIHRLLGFNPAIGGFFYNKNNPLPYDIIIIDEISMVDAKLLGFLLLAMRTGAKLIMLGDSQQLESIGIPVMIPMLKSGLIPTMTLTQIHRQAQKSAVVTDSIAIRKGINVLKNAPTEGRVVHGELKDLEYELVKEDDNIFLHVVREFHKYVMANGENIMDVQILTQQREKGKASCLTLNKACQKIYNPASPNKKEHFVGRVEKKKVDGVEVQERIGYYLREGDKVINVKNNYNSVDENGASMPVFNGNIGIIERFDEDEEGDGYVVINFEGIGKVRIYEDSYRKIELGYCITVHKSQGSSSKIIILALPFHYTLNTRQLLYTAITRTREHCVTIAMKKTIRSCIDKDDVSNKNTYLSEYLQNLSMSA